jgi:vacuolar protein sorting-associated protein 13D
MKVSRQRLKPGSGHLKCEMFNDGPTRVLRIVNVNPIIYQQVQQLLHSLNNASNNNKDTEVGHDKTNEVYIHLPGGIGISLVMWLNQEYEELVYTYFKMIDLNFEQTDSQRKIDFKIDSIQACNQLLNSQRKNFIYIQMPTNSSIDESQKEVAIRLDRMLTSVPLKKLPPALSVTMSQKFNYENLVLIKELRVDLADVNLQIEEKLLWKLLQFIGFNKENIQRSISKKVEEEPQHDETTRRHNYLNIQESILNLLNSNDNTNSFKICSNLTNNYYKSIIDSLILSSKSTKYCFNEFKINTIKMNLSVYKTSKLSNDLIKIKSSLGIPLIQFENARIELNPFLLMNEYDSSTAIGNIVTKHYAQELKSHAMRILGSVDFLGNPLGLYADFLDSFSSVLSNGDFTELIFNLTHGVANSASKFTGSLSNELTELSMDEKHQETRETIRNNFSNGSVDHFIGGALGFAVGVFGGLTSVFSQTYRGYSENGLSGAFIGLGKGAIGTVSKPVVGILDLANGVATAIRDTSKTIDKMEIPRIRETRCCSTPGALLTSFASTDADGQKMLYKVNNFYLNEKYMSSEQLDDFLIGLVTSERVLFLAKSSSVNEPNIIYQATYQELKGMKIVDENLKTYLELFLENPVNGETKSSRFQCKNRVVFNSFANKVRFAKASYDETKYAIVYDFEE